MAIDKVFSKMVEPCYHDLINPHSRINMGYKMVLGFLRSGNEWSPTGFQQWYSNQIPLLEDFECKLMSMDLPLTWRQVRAGFPQMEEPVNEMPI